MPDLVPAPMDDGGETLPRRVLDGEPLSLSGPAADTLRHIYEAERRNYWEAANLLGRSMTFYLAISGAVLAYALTRELPPPLPKYIAWTGLAISFFYIIALGTGVRGLLAQLTTIHRLQATLLTGLPKGIIRVDEAGRRRVVRIIAVCTFGVLSLVIAGLVYLIFRAEPIPTKPQPWVGEPNSTVERTAGPRLTGLADPSAGA